MDKTNLFSIGNIAKLFSLSVGSLRHYENLGILKPEYIDEKTGYRYYSTNQFECLNTIRYLRLLDMPLEQIGDFLNNRDISKMQEMLHQQKEYVVEKQKELRNIEKKINNRLNQIEDALSSQLDKIKIQNISSKRIAYLQQDNCNRLNLENLEQAIRQIEKNQKYTAVFLGKVGIGIAKENKSLIITIWFLLYCKMKMNILAKLKFCKMKNVLYFVFVAVMIILKNSMKKCLNI